MEEEERQRNDVETVLIHEFLKKNNFLNLVKYFENKQCKHQQLKLQEMLRRNQVIPLVFDAKD